MRLIPHPPEKRAEAGRLGETARTIANLKPLPDDAPAAGAFLHDHQS
jgi:hypothetical protein